MILRRESSALRLILSLMAMVAPRAGHNLAVAVVVEEEKPAASGTALGIIRDFDALLRALNHFIIAIAVGRAVVFSVIIAHVPFSFDYC